MYIEQWDPFFASALHLDVFPADRRLHRRYQDFSKLGAHTAG